MLHGNILYVPLVKWLLALVWSLSGIPNAKKNKLKFDNPKLCCVNFIDVDEINT